MDGDLATRVAHALNPRALELILLPTEQCNFRCRYCYEDFADGRMQESVIFGIKNLLAARAPELDDLRVSWFGGEPLLNRHAISEISRFCVDLEAAWPNLKYRGSMTTNASLLDHATLAQLVAWGIAHYQITLDGPEHLHDQLRVTRTGKGTFDKVWRNLLAMKSSPFAVKVAIRLHYRRESYTELFPLIDSINAEFAGDDRFEVLLKAVARLGGAADGDIQPVSALDQRAIEQDLFSRLRLAVQTADGPYVCYAADANSLVIRANGEINKCTVALRDDINRIGRLNIDGSVTIDQAKFRRWIEPLVSGDPDRMECPYGSLRGSTPAGSRPAT